LRLKSRDYALLHHSVLSLSLLVSIHPDINASEVSLSVGDNHDSGEFLHKVKLPFDTQPPLEEPVYPVWEFKLPEESVSSYQPGDSVPIALEYLDAQTAADSVIPILTRLDKVNAVTGVPIQDVTLARCIEFEDVFLTSSPVQSFAVEIVDSSDCYRSFAVVVKAKAGLNAPKIESVKLRSWGEEYWIEPGPPLLLGGKTDVVVEPVTPSRNLICELDIPLNPSLEEAGLYVSDPIVFVEAPGPVLTGEIPFVPVTGDFIFVPAVAKGMVHFDIDGFYQLYTVRDCTIDIIEVKGLVKPADEDNGEESKAYKSLDNQGRIYTNRDPDGSVKKNVQYVVITVIVRSKEALDLSKHFVRFKVVDPDDPSDRKEIDENGKKGNDNYRKYPETKKKFFFEQENDEYQIQPHSRVRKKKKDDSEYREKVCCKLKDLNKVENERHLYETKVRLHVTDASGDNYKVIADVVEGEWKESGEGDKKTKKWEETLKDCGQDATGIMTVWRKVRLELDVMRDKADPNTNYLKKWLDGDWAKEIIKQLNESYNPKAFIEEGKKEKKPPKNVCYVEFHNAGASTTVKNKEPVKISTSENPSDYQKYVVRKKSPPEVRKMKDTYELSSHKAPNYVYSLAVGRSGPKTTAYGAAYSTLNWIFVSVGNAEDAMHKYATGTVPEAKAQRYYKRGSFSLNLSQAQIKERMAALIRKFYVHEMGHIFLGKHRFDHNYKGEAVIRTPYSNSLKVLLDFDKKLKQLVFFLGQHDSTTQRLNKKLKDGTIATGDVMNMIWMRAVSDSSIPGQTIKKTQRYASQKTDPFFEFDLGDAGTPTAIIKGGFLRNLYFCPKNIKSIRIRKDPF